MILTILKIFTRQGRTKRDFPENKNAGSDNFLDLSSHCF